MCIRDSARLCHLQERHRAAHDLAFRSRVGQNVRSRTQSQSRTRPGSCLLDWYDTEDRVMQGRPSISGDVLTSPRLAPVIKSRARRQSDGRRRTSAQIADHAGYALPHEGTWPAWAGRLPQCHVGAHLVAVCVAALRTRGALVSFSAARTTPRATSTSRAFRRLAVGPVLPERPYCAKE